MDSITAALFALVGLSVFSSLCLVSLFLYIPQLREGPGQLILAHTQAQILLNLHWLSLDVVWSDKHSTACQVVGFFCMLGYVLSCAYASAICVAVSRHFEEKELPAIWKYHVCVSVLAVAICVVLAGADGLGQSTFGTCSIRKGSWAEYVVFRLSELCIIGLSICVCTAATISFIRRFSANRKFTLNSLIVAFIYLAMWTPSSLIHFLSYSSFHRTISPTVTQVKETFRLLDSLERLLPL